MENFKLLHTTATTADQLDTKLNEHIANIVLKDNIKYCEWLDTQVNQLADKELKAFKNEIRVIQRNLNKKSTQEMILGEKPTDKIILTKVKSKMVENGEYPKESLGKYVFNMQAKPEPKDDDDFITAMTKLMKKHGITNDELRTQILNENFK